MVEQQYMAETVSTELLVKRVPPVYIDICLVELSLTDRYRGAVQASYGR